MPLNTTLGEGVDLTSGEGGNDEDREADDSRLSLSLDDPDEE